MLLKNPEPSLNGQEREHVFFLIPELRRVVDEVATLGPIDVRASVERQSGALEHIAASVLHEGRGLAAFCVLSVIGKVGSSVRLIIVNADVLYRIAEMGAAGPWTPTPSAAATECSIGCR